jgi:hypothetical protein
MVVRNLDNRNLAVNGNVFAAVKRNGAVVSRICQRNRELDARFNNTEGD